MRIGVFGGTFNPVHYGHLRAAEEAAEVAGLDRILFMPSGNPPLKTAGIADARHRLKMVRLATSGNRRFRVLDLECRMPGKSYTVQTIGRLRKKYPRAEVHFMLGIDAFLDIPNWWQPDRLLAMVDFLVMSRPGTRFADLAASPAVGLTRRELTRLDRGRDLVRTARLRSGRGITLLSVTPLQISSTGVRSILRSGMSAKYLLPPEVESYIIFHKLYADASEDV